MSKVEQVRTLLAELSRDVPADTHVVAYLSGSSGWDRATWNAHSNGKEAHLHVAGREVRIFLRDGLDDETRLEWFCSDGSYGVRAVRQMWYDLGATPRMQRTYHHLRGQGMKINQAESTVLSVEGEPLEVQEIALTLIEDGFGPAEALENARKIV